MEGQGAHEHRERVGMLFPYSIWSETERRVMLDGGMGVGFLPAVMAAGVLRATATEGGEGGARSLQGNEVVLLVPLVRVRRLCNGGATARPSGGGGRGSLALWSGSSGGGSWD
jgi:hypothetical protein